jgi:hypothetical protein
MTLESLTLTAELADMDASFRSSLFYGNPSAPPKGLPLFDEVATLSFQGEIIEGPASEIEKWAMILIAYSSRSERYLGELKLLNKAIQATLNVSKDTFQYFSTLAHSGRLLKMSLSYDSATHQVTNVSLTTDKT